MNMKGMNAYQHFGLRQPWVEHFMADGVNCFGQGVLGNRQYDALKSGLEMPASLNPIKTKPFRSLLWEKNSFNGVRIIHLFGPLFGQILPIIQRFVGGIA